MAGQHVFMPLLAPEAKCAGYQGAEQMHKTSAAENRVFKQRIRAAGGGSVAMRRKMTVRERAQDER